MKKRPLNLTDSIISVIIVTHNDDSIVEKKVIEINKILKRLRVPYEIIVVDSNSTDKTVAVVRGTYKKYPNTRVLVLSKKYSIDVSLSAGLDNCIGDYVILFNIHTDPTSVIVKILTKLLESFETVFGTFNYSLSNTGALNKTLIGVTNKFSTHKYRDPQNFLLGLNRKAVNSITRTRRKARNIIYIHSLIGLRKYEFTYNPLRTYMKKVEKQNLFSLLVQILDTSISNSFRPIRILSLAGLTVSLTYIFYVGLMVFLVVVFGMEHLVPQGWISTSTVFSVLFFVLFSLLALISEYLIRSITETRDEPFYFISDDIDKSVIMGKKHRNIR